MALNEAYGRTDTAHDRNYQLAILRGAYPKNVHEAALRQLEEIDREEAAGRQQGQFNVAHAQQLAEFKQRQSESKETSEANRASRELYQRGLEESRQANTQIRQEAQNARETGNLQLAMSDPNLSKEERAAAKQKYLSKIGVQVAPNAAGAKQGAYGPGGAPATPNVPAGAPSTAPVTGPSGGYQPPATQPAGGPPQVNTGAGGYTPQQGVFTGQGAPPPQTGGKTFVSPQELSPGPNASPAASERAFALKQALREHPDQYTEGEAPAGPAIGGGQFANAGAATYAPDLQANVITSPTTGERQVVGAPDTSVGALKGSTIKDIGKSRLGNNMYELGTPSGGTIRASYKGDFNTYAAQHPDYRNVTGQTPGQIAGREPVANPPPKETDLGGNLFTPPTAAFTTGGSQAQPGAQPAGGVPGPISQPAKIQIGGPGQTPVTLATFGLNPNVPSNQTLDVNAKAGMPQSIYGPGSNQAQDAAAALAANRPPPYKPPPPPPPKKDQT